MNLYLTESESKKSKCCSISVRKLLFLLMIIASIVFSCGCNSSEKTNNTTASQSAESFIYDEAKNWMLQGDYDSAIAGFRKIYGYKDADAMLEYCSNMKSLNLAKNQYAQGQYSSAIVTIIDLPTCSERAEILKLLINSASIDLSWLADEYENNSVRVENNYLGKYYVVSGTSQGTAEAVLGEDNYLKIKVGSHNEYAHCYDLSASEINAVNKDDIITLIGRLDGYYGFIGIDFKNCKIITSEDLYSTTSLASIYNIKEDTLSSSLDTSQTTNSTNSTTPSVEIIEEDSNYCGKWESEDIGNLTLNVIEVTDSLMRFELNTSSEIVRLQLGTVTATLNGGKGTFKIDGNLLVSQPDSFSMLYGDTGNAGRKITGTGTIVLTDGKIKLSINSDNIEDSGIIAGASFVKKGTGQYDFSQYCGEWHYINDTASETILITSDSGKYNISGYGMWHDKILELETFNHKVHDNGITFDYCDIAQGAFGTGTITLGYDSISIKFNALENPTGYPAMSFDIEYTQLSDSHVKVTFDGNGGKIPDINGDFHTTTEILTLYGQPVSEELRPEKKDCEFVGWYDNKACTGEAWDFVYDEVSEDMTLYAKYRPVQYTVTFDPDGGKCDIKTKDYSFGLAMDELPIPTKANYQFVGWYTRKSANGTLYDETTVMPKSDVKLYAGWLQEGKSIIVELDANGGKCDTQKIMVQYNQPMENLPTPTLTGHKFTGWNSAPDGSGTTYSKSTPVKNLNLNLYAVWETKSYTVKLDINGGECSVDKKTVKYSSKIGTIATPKRDGFKFLGWYYSDGTKFTSNDIMPAKSITLKAKWRGLEYMILFDARSGKCDTETMFISCGDNVGDLPVPTRKGYVFQGWYTKAKCQGTKYTSTTEMPEKDITLYAGWKKASYATAVKLNKTAITLGVGQTYTVKATTKPKVSLDKLTWTTSNSKVATVSSTGKITAKSTGTAKITVTTTKGYKASVTVTVKKAVTALKSAYYKRTLAVGQVATLKITSTGYAGVITYTSNDTKVVTVDKRGNITAVSKGTAIITVRAYNGVYTQITITVE